MEQEPVVGIGDVLDGDIAHELLLDLQRRIGSLGNEAQTVADTIDMGIDSHGGLAEPHGLDDIGGLAPYARQRHELGAVGGNLAMEVADQLARHGYQMVGLGIGIAHRTDELQHIVDLGLGHGLRGGITGEKGWGNLVDALVSALGTEERGYQQLESRTKLELGGNLGHGFTIIIEHTLVTLLTGHNKICVG